MSTMILIEKAADLTKAIDSIATRGKKLDRDIHVAATSCLAHADKHGDVTLMQRLLTALPASSRRNAVIAWAVAFGKFLPSADGKSVEFNKTGTTDLSAAMLTAPWGFKPEAPFTTFDLGKELAKLVKAAEKAAKDERNSLPEEGFRALRELASKVPASVAPVKAVA